MVKADEANAVWYRNPKFQHCLSSARDAIVPEQQPKLETVPLRTAILSAKDLTETHQVVERRWQNFPSHAINPFLPHHGATKNDS